MTATYASGDLSAAFAKAQFEVTAEYGGSSVNTDTESYNEATEVSEKVSLKVKPGKTMYVWQYQLGIGKDSLLFCRDLVFDDDPNPPKKVPLPAAK